MNLFKMAESTLADLKTLLDSYSSKYCVPAYAQGVDYINNCPCGGDCEGKCTGGCTGGFTVG